MGRGWGVVAEQGSVNSPVERGEGSVYTRKPLRGTCVCVCVRERERAREKQCAASQGSPPRGLALGFSRATLIPRSLGQDTAA